MSTNVNTNTNNNINTSMNFDPDSDIDDNINNSKESQSSSLSVLFPLITQSSLLPPRQSFSNEKSRLFQSNVYYTLSPDKDNDMSPGAESNRNSLYDTSDVRFPFSENDEINAAVFFDPVLQPVVSTELRRGSSYILYRSIYKGVKTLEDEGISFYDRQGPTNKEIEEELKQQHKLDNRVNTNSNYNTYDEENETSSNSSLKFISLNDISSRSSVVDNKYMKLETLVEESLDNSSHSSSHFMK